MAKFTVHYVVRGIVDIEVGEGQNLANIALWHARNRGGARARLVQVLPAGCASELLDDLPPEPPSGPLPPPDPGPLAPAADQMDLRRAA